MDGPLPFAVHATIGCPTHADLALSLAWTLRDVDVDAGAVDGIVSNGSDHCLGHTRLGEPLLLDLERGAVVDARLLAPTLTWRCAHEICGQLLDALEARWLEQRPCVEGRGAAHRAAVRRRRRARGRAAAAACASALELADFRLRRDCPSRAGPRRSR